MTHQDFISVKQNPQYQIQFLKDSGKLPLITWISITKILIKQNNENEDAEKATDYLAMHVYNNDSAGHKVLNPGSPLIKSTYTNEQTVMLYVTGLDRSTYVDTGKALALVLD